jgi:hypothetical protein
MTSDAFMSSCRRPPQFAAFDQSTNSNNEAVLKNLSATALDWA